MRGLIVSLALSAASITAHAADRPIVAPPPAWVLAAPIPPPPPGTEGVAVAALLADEQTRLTNDGDARYVETAFRIGSSQGLQAAALALAWDPALETLVIHRYRIVRDGKVIDLLGDGSKLTVVRRETNLERATLDGQLTATLQPEDVRVGDTIDIAFTQTRRDPALAGRSQAVFGIAPGLTFGRARVRALWPATKPVHWQALPGVFAPKERRVGDEREMIADAANTTTARPPKGAPFRFGLVNLVQVSDMGSWRDVSQLMAPLYAKAAVPGTAVRAEAARIAAASADPKTRALAALKLVQEQVRYVLLAMDDGGYVPAPADTTWQRRFGDCKGKTVLLLALLHELGIEARPALVSTGGGDGLDTRLPMAGAFDHVLVQATIGGRTFWLDGTRPGDRALDQIRTPEFHWALPVTSKGEDLVPLVPDPLAGPQEVTTLDLDASKGLDVPARASGEQRLEGDAALVWRVGLAQLPPEQRDRALKDYWHRNYEFVTADTVAVADDAATGTIRLTMRGTAKMDWERSGDRRYYQVDGGTLGEKMDIARDDGPNKTAPFALDFPSFREWRQTILLPNNGYGFTIQGGDVDRTIGSTVLHRKVTLAAGKYAMQSSERTIAPEFAFADAESIRTAMAELSDQSVLVRAPANYRATDGDLAVLKATTPTTADAFVERGTIFYNRGSYADALRDFDAAIALQPGLARAHGFRALVLASTGDAKFEAAAARAAALDPKDARPWNARAIAAMRAERHGDADAALTKSLELWTNYDWALAQRAMQRAAMGRTDDALNDIDRAIQAAPENRQLGTVRMSILVQAGRSAQAMAELGSYLKIHNDDFVARANYAMLLVSAGRRDEARAELDRLVADHPGDESALHARARERLRMGDRAGAFADFQTMIDAKPSAENLLERAQLWRPEDRAHWQADLDRAETLKPGDPSVAKARAVVLARAGDYKAAEVALERAQKAAPADPQIITIRSDIFRREGRREEAVGLLEAEVRKRPPTAEALNHLCWTKATMNIRLDSALADCEAALKLAPGNAAALDSRAFVKLRLGQVDGALADYDAALKLRPEQAGSLYGRALAKTSAGQNAAADLAAARKANPKIDVEYAAYGMKAPDVRPR